MPPEHEVHGVARATSATVVGRTCGELVSLRTEQGGALSIRVEPTLWWQLPLGTRAWVELNERGAAAKVRPIEKGSS